MINDICINQDYGIIQYNLIATKMDYVTLCSSIQEVLFFDNVLFYF
jgi:hypothetical protein